tara:strand:- start:32 stop:211 length:180 start_codon:yes stop_codon:yes gene_type:complete
MKLNEYIQKKLEVRHRQMRADAPKSFHIEEWIIEWYEKTYDRLPPTWLADTTDLRKKIQ